MHFFLINQNDININYKNSLNDIINKIENTKIIIQNLNNKNDNKNKINIENKKIIKYEMINDKPKLYKMSQWNNQISFQDITNECEEDKMNKTIEKIKISFKKDEDEKDKIIYEVSNLYKEWDFKRHIKSIFKRINKAKEIKRINLNKLKYVYILKFTENQIHFIKKEAILNFVKNNNFLNFVKNNNFYVKIGNNFIFVNNKRRKFYNNRKWYGKNFNYRKNNSINKNGNIKNNNLNRRNNINNFNNNKPINQKSKFSGRRNQNNKNRYNNNGNRKFNKFKRRKNFNNKTNFNNRNKFNKQNF